MSLRIATIVACVALSIFPSCNEEFDPRSRLDEQMAVFSLLSTDRTMQFVIVQTSYMPPEFDPLSYSSDNALSDASVSIRESSRIFRLRDTLLARSDTSRYKFPLRTYYISPFTPQRGKSYQVIIQSPSRGQVSSNVTIPNQPFISLPSGMLQILDRPDRSPQDAPIVFVVQLSRDTKGFVGRLYLYYDVLKGSEWIEERAEIPVSSADSSSYSFDLPRYPQLAAAPLTYQLGLVYRTGYYRAVINVLNSKYKSTRLIFKWATFVILQADGNLFEYYSSTHASQDPFSIRLDEPMVSRVSGGLGMVGAYTLDSLVNILPENFWGNR